MTELLAIILILEKTPVCLLALMSDFYLNQAAGNNAVSRRQSPRITYLVTNPLLWSLLYPNLGFDVPCKKLFNSEPFQF
jgi:hypothetical protein